MNVSPGKEFINTMDFNEQHPEQHAQYHPQLKVQYLGNSDDRRRLPNNEAQVLTVGGQKISNIKERFNSIDQSPISSLKDNYAGYLSAQRNSLAGTPAKKLNNMVPRLHLRNVPLSPLGKHRKQGRDEVRSDQRLLSMSVDVSGQDQVFENGGFDFS